MADVILHALVRSRETFSLPAGSQRYFFYSQTCFPVFAWHYVKLFYSLRVWHALFSLFRPAFCLFTGLSDTFSLLRPAFPFLLGIMSTFFILCRSNSHFFFSQTRILPLYGSGSYFFSSQTRSDFHAALKQRVFLLSNLNSGLFHDSSHIFQHCFIPFSHLSGILIIVKRKSPLTQFLFHNMAGKHPTSYRLLLLFIK